MRWLTRISLPPWDFFMIARHLRDETSRARRCRRFAPERVWRSWTQSRRLVHRPEQCLCEHVLDCAGHRGKGCRDYRRRVGNQGCRLRRCVSIRSSDRNCLLLYVYMVYVFIRSGTTTDVQVVLLLLYSRCLGIDLVPDPCAQLQSASLGYFGLWPIWRVVRALKMTRDTTCAGAKIVQV